MKKVSMTLADFIKEHEHLVKVLKNGTKYERNREADKQMKELRMKLYK